MGKSLLALMRMDLVAVSEAGLVAAAVRVPGGATTPLPPLVLLHLHRHGVHL
jgi:hypothetical protein